MTGARGPGWWEAKAVALLLAAALLAAGCGGDDAPSATATPTPTPTPTPTAAPVADEQAIEHPAVRRMPPTEAGAAAGFLPLPASSDVGDPRVMRAAFTSSQSMWEREFTAAGLRYEPADLVFLDAEIPTRCGVHGPATGPFYCPASHTVYLAPGFFDTLARAYGLRSGYAAGYVTAHEVGHHVQQLLGVHARVAAADQRAPATAGARSIRVELQADCYAGVWLHTVARRGELSEADVRDILTAAASAGDDHRRRSAGAALAPETWTHGSSAQRVHWTGLGIERGAPAECDTFA